MEDDETRVFYHRDVVYEYYREPRFIPTGPDPYDGVYNNLPKKHHVLKKAKNCEFCNAKRFLGEGPAFCCKNRKHIWYFNSHFSFTSFGGSIDRRLTFARGTGVYTFKAHGQIYHKLDPLVPGGKGPCHMQLYIYDTDDSVAHQYTIELNTKISVDQRRYNALKMEQIAAIWVDANDSQHRFSWGIVIYGKSDDPHYIRVYHGCYDPLAYPLFFFGGEVGWEDKTIEFRDPPPSKLKRKYTKRKRKDLPIDEADDTAYGDFMKEEDTRGSHLYVSAREYKCYKL
uniref:Uncharacterized protein n=1 Tax=Setaria viridis TaxID=4556 RepID=A0A4U6V029_SETVI|nr:hypothetical protein SEVIR_4G224800v2 [Setaria viridis]